jgi:hypothetical protein
MILSVKEGSLMFLNSGFASATKVCFFTILLTQSMILQAETPETTAGENAVSGTAAVTSSEQRRAFFLPRWPQQKKDRMERVPPPPPGPYMSTALSGSGSTVKGPTFAPNNKPAIRMAPPGMSMDTFSPDIPWPSSNTDSPQRWKPESGYSYVMPQLEKQPYNAQPNYNYGYGYPHMRPSTGMDQGRPYSNAPNNPAPQYRQPAY